MIILPNSKHLTDSQTYDIYNYRNLIYEKLVSLAFLDLIKLN